MNHPNLYWPVYKNLEKEFLQLADYIHFIDDQIGVYSMHVADLIVRCAIEIEAIAKELYVNLGGNTSPVDSSGNTRDLFFDTDCLNLMEEKWLLSKKQLIVSAPTFYFSDRKYRVINPLHKANKRGSSGSKWKQSYQALKHNRKASLKKANIENLLHSLGALFLLNIYYKDENYSLGRKGQKYKGLEEFDIRVGSDIFSVVSYKATSISMAPNIDDSCIMEQEGNVLEKSTYIIKYKDESLRKMHENNCKDNEVTMQNFMGSPKIREFLQNNPGHKDKSINEICLDAGGIDLVRQIVSSSNIMKNRDIETEAIINKHSTIYPTLTS